MGRQCTEGEIIVIGLHLSPLLAAAVVCILMLYLFYYYYYYFVC
jgi:uncharacterized membrane protein